MSESMSPRERVIAVVEGRQADRVPFVIHWGPWGQAHERWKREGMGQDHEWHSLFGFDPFLTGSSVNFGLCPAFEPAVIDDEGETVVVRGEQGILKRERKDGMSMPQFLEYPVRDRKTWEEHKWRFDPDTPERFPADWSEQAGRLRESEALVTVGTYPYGFYGGVRTMMGAEASLIACADDPELIDDINEHLCRLWESLWDRVMQETRVDHVAMWEDMAGRQGSLISPAMFRRFLTPYYQRLTALGRRHGAKVFSVDSDGFMHELTALFLEAGINVILPYEVQAGNDVPMLRGKHPELSAWGCMDKRAMAQGGTAIEAEMERVEGLLACGRCIPFPDHLIPSDVSWANYQAFVWRWKELVGKKG